MKKNVLQTENNRLKPFDSTNKERENIPLNYFKLIHIFMPGGEWWSKILEGSQKRSESLSLFVGIWNVERCWGTVFIKIVISKQSGCCPDLKTHTKKNNIEFQKSQTSELHTGDHIPKWIFQQKVWESLDKELMVAGSQHRDALKSADITGLGFVRHIMHDSWCHGAYPKGSLGCLVSLAL